MQAPAKPTNEATRLRALNALEVLDTPPEERFDRVTRLARRSFRVPIALVSLVDADRQWFKSRQGLDASETPRDVSFCGHAILRDEVLVVNDALEDERFADNPLVTGDPNVRFYAGRPLKAPDGSAIGTLCLIDQQPRGLDEEDLELLNDLAHMVEEDLANRALATTDELTGLSNRRGFTSLAEHGIAMCQRMKRPASLLYLDLDGFKPINDTFGHHEGDRALCGMAEVLLDSFRDSDVIARIGGDEFCVFLAGPADPKAPIVRLEQNVAAWNDALEQAYTLAYSLGRVDYDPERHASLQELMREADQRMYERKRQGGTSNR